MDQVSINDSFDNLQKVGSVRKVTVKQQQTYGIPLKIVSEDNLIISYNNLEFKFSDSKIDQTPKKNKDVSIRNISINNERKDFSDFKQYAVQETPPIEEKKKR